MAGIGAEGSSGSETAAQPPSDAVGIDRRRLLQRGAILAGAVAAPIVYDSFAAPALASGTSLYDSETPGTAVRTIPANRQVSFTIIGGGGGGSSFQGYNGGSGTKLTGTIASSTSSRDVNIVVAGGGQGSEPYEWEVSFRRGGAGGTGYCQGGSGGTVDPTVKGGGGGGGGGASAVYLLPDLAVIAPGGGGSGGGGDATGRVGSVGGGAVTGSVTNTTVAGLSGFTVSSSPGGHGAGGQASAGGAGGSTGGGGGTQAAGGDGSIEPRHVVGIECDARCGQLSSWSWSGSVSRGWLSSAIEVSER